MSELSINNGNFLWMTRGKEWGFRFLSKCSSFPSAIDVVYKRVFLYDESRFGYWKGYIFVDGVRKPYVACRCYDTTIQRDQAGRRIPHEFLLLCTDQEYNFLNCLTWESLILEQVRGLYSDRYPRCADAVTDCLIDFRIRLDSRIEYSDSCVSLDVYLSTTLPLSDRGICSPKRNFAKPFLSLLLLMCFGIGYISTRDKSSRVKFCENGNNIFIRRIPVTVAEWMKFTCTTIPSNSLYLPVTNISIKDAERHCHWFVQGDTVLAYRLPIETEWEYASWLMSKDSDSNLSVVEGGKSVKSVDGHTTGAPSTSGTNIGN